LSNIMSVAAIVVAAGEGTRLGGSLAKPYVALRGRPMLLRTLDQVVLARCVETVVVVAAAAELSRCEAMLMQEPAFRDRRFVVQSGGATRQDSVRRGLEKVTDQTAVVIIHDGARPFVAPTLLDRCADEAYQRGAVVVGVPARDTIKVVSEERLVRATLDRKTLWEIQTPQAFRREWIAAAHERAVRENVTATDDAALIEWMGRPVFVLEGERTNFKITTPEDLWLAEALLRDGRLP
jgi:2-C-methyl-D-erythritol 4-phosphate cytidylyltransferase